MSTNLKLNPYAQNVLDLLLVIDTENLKDHYRNPGKDSEHPTTIDEKYYRILCPDYDGIKQSQQNKIDLKVIIMDAIHFKGVSLSQNCDDAVILYNIRTNGSGVINNFYQRSLDVSVVGPNTSLESSLPAQNYNAKFKKLGYLFTNTGTERVTMFFAVYNRNSPYNQELYGYFSVDVDIVVSHR